MKTKIRTFTSTPALLKIAAKLLWAILLLALLGLNRVAAQSFDDRKKKEKPATSEEAAPRPGQSSQSDSSKKPPGDLSKESFSENLRRFRESAYWDARVREKQTPEEQKRTWAEMSSAERRRIMNEVAEAVRREEAKRKPAAEAALPERRRETERRTEEVRRREQAEKARVETEAERRRRKP